MMKSPDAGVSPGVTDWKTYRRLLTYAYPYRWRLVVGLVAGALFGGSTLGALAALRGSLVAVFGGNATAINRWVGEALAGYGSSSTQVAVVHEGRIVWSRAFGEHTSPNHVYMNASVQKMFTAAAVLQLVDRGLVDLDADVGE